MVYKPSNFWKNLKEKGLIQAVQIDWEETRKHAAFTATGQKLEEKLNEIPTKIKSPVTEWNEGQYKFRVYGEWIQTRLESGNLGLLSEELSADQQKTGRKTVMLEILDGRGHQYVLSSQPFEESRKAIALNEKVVFEYAGEKELILKEGKFSEGPKKVFSEHHAYHKRRQRKNYC
ncbi:MAG: hypothetical protein AABW48_03035 [Nanoarchaeota archaeon]